MSLEIWNFRLRSQANAMQPKFRVEFLETQLKQFFILKIIPLSLPKNYRINVRQRVSNHSI